VLKFTLDEKCVRDKEKGIFRASHDMYIVRKGRD